MLYAIIHLHYLPRFRERLAKVEQLVGSGENHAAQDEDGAATGQNR